MKSITMDFPTVSLLLLLGAGFCHSQVITPAGVTATSSLDANRDIGHTISGAGLSGGGAPILEQTHNNTVNGTYWLGAIADGQVLTFDLGGANDVQFIYIWQYWRDNATWANRAIQSFDVAYSTDGGSNYSTPVAGPSGLTLGAAASPAQTLDLGSAQSGVTHVQLTNNPLFPALRSGHRLFQRPSHRKQIPSSNRDFLSFAPHGAGRNLSRTALMRKFPEPKDRERQLAESTAGIDVRWFSGVPDLSETPVAYKNAAEVKQQIADFGLAEVIAEIRPLGCVMAGHIDQPWRSRKDKLSPKQLRQIDHRAERRKLRQRLVE